LFIGEIPVDECSLSFCLLLIFVVVKVER
jgi:hypothetical protein